MRYDRGMRSLWIAMILVGCGGGDEGGGGLDERITQTAYAQACSEAEDFLVSQYSDDYFVQALCTARAVEGNLDAAACADDLDACINTPPAEIQQGIDAILGQAGCDAFSLDPSTCSSTVGELKACLDALSDEVSSLQYTLTCAAAGQTLEGWDVVELPVACSFADDC
jgi:hypothetical protein